MKRASTVVIAIGVLLIVGVLSFPAIVTLVTDWWWFSAIGYSVVFTKALITQIVLGSAAAAVSFAFLYANFRFAQRGAVPPDPVIVNIHPKASKVDVTRGLRILALPFSALISLLIGVSVSGSWLTVLRFLHRTPFGETDPAFGRDIGYYIFNLPLFSGTVGAVQAIVFLTLFLVLAIYVLRGDFLVLRNRVTVEPSAQLHIGFLLSILFLATAINIFFVRIPSLVYSTTDPLFGAAYTDLSMRLPILRISAVLGLAAAAAVLFGASRRSLVPYTAAAVAAYFGFSALIGGALPALIQRLVVLPNELVKETPQLEHHITATKRAWGLDNVTVRDLSGDAELTLADIQANEATIKNVRLWDRDPLLQTFGQLQEIRTYYDFLAVDDDRYWIDGEYRQVLLSPRELSTASLPTKTFINERLTFTHGMGLTLSPVNRVTPEGLPYLFIKDLPPVSNVSLQVTRPEIYYGESSSGYVFVNTGQMEFDYPSGDTSAMTNYRGAGGVAAGGFLRKLFFSARFKSLKIFLSDDINAESRAVFVRNIRARAAKALPFVAWDRDPFIVIDDEGRLKWFLDGYTMSSRYPYSRPVDGINYMRNSIKVVIDAYDGTVEAYIADPTDPIVQTYSSIFPGVLHPIDDMPADLRAHVRYPEDLFRAQTELYTIYHMDQPDVFYHREDQWQIPTSSAQESARHAFLRHIVMTLPGEDDEEFIFMIPYTPRGKENLAAWMVARNDGDRYGELVVYRFPRQSLVFGPNQIVNRINQNTDISRQVSLWDQRGSQVIRGNLLVIPIEEALVFVQAIYLQADNGRIPELKRVVVAYQNQVVMEETLDAGLTRLFGGRVQTDDVPALELTVVAASPSGGVGLEDDVAALAAQAAEHYDRAVAAQRAGDWSLYGQELDLMGQALSRLREITENND